ncbi:Imm45 family immunity protein [Atopomonas hussainii]|uniref:Imm45 family immunity protein n=1 Tax=Atopomonas hussainii TaxID=1429083 RepID=UPI0008FFF71B|nr:Imm45 family immunity protein [Atopomonas hussainii]
MKWHTLTTCTNDSFGRGTVFRFPTKHPFEEIVDFMIIEESESPSSYKLICSSGYHSGQTELVFPAEAAHKAGGISAAWLRDNWSLWIYPECEATSVEYINYYPPNYGVRT